MSTTENRAAANIAVVGGIYEAFGRGDIEFILDQIAEDCAWESWLDNHGQGAGIPPMQPRHGRPSLSTSGETLTIEESMTLRARTENAGHAGDEHEWSWAGG